MKIHNVLENPQIPNRNFWRYFSSHRQKHSRPIPPICDFSRGVLNVRLKRSHPTLAPRPQKDYIILSGLYCYRFCCHARLKRINSESKARTFLKDWNLWGIYYLFNLCFRICNSDEKRTSESGFSLYVIEHPRGGRCYFYY